MVIQHTGFVCNRAVKNFWTFDRPSSKSFTGGHFKTWTIRTMVLAKLFWIFFQCFPKKLMDFVEPGQNILRGIALRTEISDDQDQGRHRPKVPDSLPAHGLICVKKDFIRAREPGVISNGITESIPGPLKIREDGFLIAGGFCIKGFHMDQLQ